MIDSILNIVNKFVPDADKAKELAVEMERETTKQIEARTSVIKQEMASGGLASKWRPLTALTFVGMVVIHFVMYDIFPWLRSVCDWKIWVPQDPGHTEGLLDLIKICLMGYIGSRSVEKSVSFWKSK